MNRRELLYSIASGFAAATIGGTCRAYDTKKVKKPRLGIADFSFNNRLRAERTGKTKSNLGDPLNFLDYCHNIGAGGIQMNIGVRDEAYTHKIRQKTEKYEMFIEGSTSLPRDEFSVEKFEAAVRSAKLAGAGVVRTAIGGRRYEQFDKVEQFKAFAEHTKQSLQFAEPVVAKHHVRLAIENHKDWRINQMLDLVKSLSSEYLGVCVDTGNSFALLEDPMTVVEAYAPYAFSVHLKDMAVAEYEDGFLLADVPLGQGVLDLARIIEILRKANPGIKFSLEMATRDALKVPCLTEKYWVTFENVPGSDLARALRYVRDNASVKQNLPKVDHLPIDKVVKIEEANIKQCLAFAKENLDL